MQPAMFEDVIRNVQVCIPFKLLKEKYLRVVLENRFNPEVGIDGEAIDTHSEKDFSEIASLLRKEDLSITLHGPFYDLVPGGMDKKILEATRERLRQTFDLIPLFEPMTLVCHTGYDRKRYREVEAEWLNTAIETWTPLVGELQNVGTTLAIENVYERTPRTLLKLIKGLNKHNVGICFDTGHMSVFSETTMEDWLTRLGPFLKEVHLHDNDGNWDYHWAINAGKIDFETLFRYMEEHSLRPIITLEAHKEKWIWDSLEVLSQSASFRRIVK